MSGAASDLEDHAIGEVAAATAAQTPCRGGDDIGLLYHQLFLVEQHLDRGRYLGAFELVDRLEDPGYLHENDVRHPGASLSDILFGSGDLRLVITHGEPDDDVGVNGAHA